MQHDVNWFSWICVSVLAAVLAPTRLPAQDLTNARLQIAAQALTAGNLNRAQNELQLVLRSSPDECRALDLLGVVRVLQRREAEAEGLFRRAIQKKPEFASAHAHLGLLF